MMMAFASGVLLGLSAGLAPGPLLALVLAQSLRYGSREGFKVALAPLLTDCPIILLALLVAAKMAELRPALGVGSLVAGGFVLYLAWDSFRSVRLEPAAVPDQPKSWLKGIVTNLLNPHPWLFWLTVGAAILARALTRGWPRVAAFLFGFYLMLVGSKMILALVAARSRNLLAGRAYRLVIRGLGVLLLFFAVLLFREGFRLLA